jgi:hypothetical protein
MYFGHHRWPLTAEDEDLFALYLSKYLASVRQWQQEYGDDFAKELMKDFELDSDHQEGSILSRWIRLDREYFGKILKKIDSPFKPSKFDPNMCELGQTMIDLLFASHVRLIPLRMFPHASKRFVQECHDEILREFVMHPLRIHSTIGFGDDDIAWIKTCMNSIMLRCTECSLVSSTVRKHFLELLDQLE